MKDNPFTSSQWYVSARERFGWRFGVAGFLYGTFGMMIGLGALAGYHELANRSQLVPMIVKVNGSGEIVGTQKVERSAPVDARIIHSALAGWISSIRLVTADVQLQREAVFKVYAFLSQEDPAYTKANAWLNGTPESSPFQRAREVTVSTEIISCIQQSDRTWQIDWLEKTFDRKGVQLRQDRMRALVTVEVAGHVRSADEDDIRRNPLAIFIRDFNWSRQDR